MACQGCCWGREGLGVSEVGMASVRGGVWIGCNARETCEVGPVSTVSLSAVVVPRLLHSQGDVRREYRMIRGRRKGERHMKAHLARGPIGSLVRVDR